MDYRGNYVINRLMDTGLVSISELSERLEMSERNIQLLVRDLSEELSGHGIPRILIDSQNNLRFERMSDEISTGIFNYIVSNNFYTYRLTQNERRTIITIIVLMSVNPSTAGELAEYLQTSRNTILSDLSEIKMFLEKNRIDLIAKVSKGYCVEGNECDIRSCILHSFELNFSFKNYRDNKYVSVFQHLIANELLKNIPSYNGIFDFVIQLLNDKEKEYGYSLSDFSFIEATYELMIMIARIAQGRTVDEQLDERLVHSSKYPMSRAIMACISEKMGFQIPESEVRNFVRCLRRKSYMTSKTNHIAELDVSIMIGEVINNIVQELNLAFYLDFNLYDVLVDHVKSAIYRTRSNEMLINPFLGDIKSKYESIFKVVQTNIKPLEQYIGGSFKDDEIAFLVMYFASMHEKKRAETVKNEKMHVMLVTDMGRGTNSLLQAELEQLSDLITIDAVKSGHNIENEIDDLNYELIISTFPLKSKSSAVICLDSPVITEEKMHHIEMTALTLLDQKHRKGLEENSRKQSSVAGCSHSYLSADSVEVDADASDWEQAVRMSGRLLLRAGAVTEEYVEAMVKNIYDNGMSSHSYIVICPGMAIPHADPDKGAMRDAVSVLRLSSPVILGTDEVRYFVGLSVLGSETANKIILNIVKIFSDQSKTEEMEKLNTAGDMFSYISRYI